MKTKSIVIVLMLVILSPMVLDSMVTLFDFEDVIELSENLEEKESEQEETDPIKEFTLFNSNEYLYLSVSSEKFFSNQINTKSVHLKVFTPPPEIV